MRAYLTADEQLVLGDAGPADAAAVWRALHGLYLAHRGPDRKSTPLEPVPATTHLDVIEVVSAFEGLASSIRRSAVRGLEAWREAYVQTFALIAAAPDRRQVFPHNDVLWLELTRPLAERLAAVQRPAAWRADGPVT